MTALLQNLAEMTTHRDHLRLEVSVLSTLQSLNQGRQVRALELFAEADTPMLRARSWTAQGQVFSSPHETLLDPQAIPLSSLPELARCLQLHHSSAQHAATGRYTLWLPVWLHERVHTCIELTQARPFSQRQRSIIEGIFQVYQNYQNLLDYSERDALTDLLNRKTFDEHFSRQIANRQSDPASAGQQWLAVIDIDHFKSVNDRFGHLFGDEVLILLAHRLRAMFRSQDKIFRFGGEEFVVLLNGLSQQQAHEALERLRVDIASHSFPQLDHITISIGYANAQGGQAVQVMGQADQALYYAKEHGRNQVRCYTTLAAEGALQTQIAHSEVELF